MKSKQFISGLIIGAILTSGVGVFASNEIISAFKTDDTFIYVDNELVELEEGFHILNYEGRVYTSVRAIAESLDAEVKYEDNKYNKNIYITKPEPEVVVVEPDPKPDPKPVTPSVDYRTPPVKAAGLGVSVTLFSATTPIDELLLELEVTNNNIEGITMFKMSEFKLVDSNGKEYKPKRIVDTSASMFFSNIPNKTEDLEETLKFAPIPAGTEVTLVMPLTRENVGGKVESYNLEIPFIIEEYDVTTSSN